MKHQSLFCSLLLLGALAACQQDPSSTGGGAPRPLTAGGHTTTPAHPALTWTGYQTVHSTLYGAVFVADSDLTHATAVHLSPSGNTSFTHASSWSPSGGSICFSKLGGTVTAP